MARKDSEKDADRPHYYSQFWLDVAAGRRIIGAPKTNEDEGDEDGDMPVSTTSYRSNTNDDDYNDNIVHPVAEPIEAPDDFIEPEADELDLATDDPDDANFAETDDTDIPDVDLDTTDEDEDEDNYFEEEEDEEEEEGDLNWGRGRKKPKPSRPTKAPTTKKPIRRDTRRNF